MDFVDVNHFEAFLIIQGVKRMVSWSKVTEKLVVEAASFADAKQLIDCIAAGRAVDPEVASILATAKFPVGTTTVSEAGANGKAAEMRPSIMALAKEKPRAASVDWVDGFPAERSRAPVEAPAVEPPPSTPSVPAHPPDDSIFLRLTKLSEVVAEVRRRGAEDYKGILAECERLKGEDMCPVLDSILDLKSRLATHCAAKGVKGATDAT